MLVETTRKAVGDNFEPGALWDKWSVVAEQKPDGQYYFLCLDWVLFRLFETRADNNSKYTVAQEKMIGLMAEGVGQRATTDYTHEKFYEALNDGGNQHFGLKPYELAGKSKDEIRKVVKEQAVVVAWAGQPIPKSVAHVSVKFNDEWESKLGDMHQVGLASAAVPRSVTTALTTGSR